jgi:hypothetical protein
MQSHRILSGLTIFLMVALVAIGYFVVAQPQLAAASAASVQLASVESSIAQSQTTVTQLKSQQKDLPTLKAQLAALRLSIPSSVDSSAYIDGLTAVASTADVTITGISVGDALAYASPVAAVVPAAAAGGTSTPSPTPTPTASAPAAPVSTSTAWVPTTDALINGSNFIAIPVKVVTTGSIDGDLAFIKGLQTAPRLFLVTGFATVKASDTGVVTSSISGYIYVIVDPSVTKDASTEKTATTPSVTATPTATPNPSGSATPTPTQSSTPTKKP